MNLAQLKREIEQRGWHYRTKKQAGEWVCNVAFPGTVTTGRGESEKQALQHAFVTATVLDSGLDPAAISREASVHRHARPRPKYTRERRKLSKDEDPIA